MFPTTLKNVVFPPKHKLLIFSRLALIFYFSFHLFKLFVFFDFFRKNSNTKILNLSDLFWKRTFLTVFLCFPFFLYCAVVLVLFRLISQKCFSFGVFLFVFSKKKVFDFNNIFPS